MVEGREQKGELKGLWEWEENGKRKDKVETRGRKRGKRISVS
jgi:hypothetical protein